MLRSKTRPKTYKCTCKSHCTTFNSSTGEYEGSGTIQSRNTRNNHRRDDRLLDARQAATSPGERSRFSVFRHSHSTQQTGALPANSQSLLSLFTRQPPTPPIDHPTISASHEPQTEWLTFIEHEVQWLSELPVTSSEVQLIFSNDAASNGEYTQPSPADIAQPNHGLHALVPGLRPNYAFLSTENRLCELLSALPTIEASERRDALSRRIYEQLDRLSQEKEYNWAQQRAQSVSGRILVNTEIHFYQHGPRNIISKAAALVCLAMELFFFTSRRARRAQLAGQRDVLRGLFPNASCLIPKDPRAISSQYGLNPVTRQFLCCPKCFCLYPFEPGDSPRNADFPAISQCTFKAAPESMPCAAPLWKERTLGNGNTRPVPWRRYLHQVLKAWVGRLLSRPNIEDLLEECQYALPVDLDGPIPDIWFSKVLRGLVDVDGNPFFPGPPGEGRLIFSLSVDSFNPFHNKTAKQTVSSTGIWLVLLNLPPHLRYLPENVFLVGVLPDHPSTTELNHALALVVEDLLEFWSPGVTYTRTYKYRAGKLVRAMLVPLVCDMIAARQVLGLPGSTSAHSFCTFCDLDQDDIDVLDPSEWPKKNVHHIREFANYWRQASTEAFQKDIFEACGVRWSALLDLPYWDPVSYAVIESMHAFDLGLFQNHLRGLFRIDVEVAIGGDGAVEPPPPEDKTVSDSDGDLRRCIKLIREDPARPMLLYELLRFRRKVLYTICVKNDIKGVGHNLVVGTRWVLAGNIFHWRHSADYDARKLSITPAVSPRTTPGLDTTSGGQAMLPENSEVNAALAMRIIKHLTDVEDQEESLRKAREQGNIVIFAYLCGILGIGHSEIDLNRRGAKGALFELLKEAMNDPAKHAQLAAYIPSKSPNRVVLGGDVMKATWADMKRTQLPTWIRPAPPNWGTSQRGKLSADQYRVICTIHLVVTLIRLWGKENGRRKEMLRHFMDLVNAVRIANLRVISQRKIEVYNEFIFRYARRWLELFPDESLKPVLHAALHMGDIMDLFGPVHAYSAPFYERYINLFHRMNTNKKRGEMEVTFMQTAARASNLRSLLSADMNLRTAVREMIQEIDATEREDARGYRLASLVDPTATNYVLDSNALPFELPDEIFQYLEAIITTSADSNRQLRVSRQAMSVNKIAVRGVTYGTSTSSTFKDSNILFQRSIDDASEEPYAGTISRILQHTYEAVGEAGPRVTECYLVVQEYLPVAASSDPYREFGFSGGFLCGRTPLASSRVIKLSQVVSHVAVTPIDDGDHAGLLHVLPLDRLMLSFRISPNTTDENDDLEEPQ